MTATELHIKEGLPFEEWVKLGRQLGHLVNATAFAVGDWMEYGQFEYGRRYEEALSLTGLDVDVLRDRQYVASHVALRTERLSWTHHRAVAALEREDQARWLGKALDGRWSVKQLREAMMAERGLPRRAAAPVFEQLRFPVERVSRWRSAAERAGAESLDSWAADVLDEAAA
jgi:hypothetical protein